MIIFMSTIVKMLQIDPFIQILFLHLLVKVFTTPQTVAEG
jgi:hypothetical protein